MNSPTPPEPQINKLFRLVNKMQATELHLHAGEPPMLRLRGDIRRMEMRPLTQQDLELLLDSIMDAEQKRALGENGTVRFAHELLKDQGLFGCKISKIDGQLTLSARLLDS
jgi:twitching motility protein PilT